MRPKRGLGTIERNRKQPSKVAEALRVIAANCDISETNLIRLTRPALVSEEIQTLSKTSPEYQRHVLDRIRAGHSTPLKKTAACALVYETVSFEEVNSRMRRALGAVGLEANLIRRQAAMGGALDRGADRMLTLDLVGEAATALAALFREMRTADHQSRVNNIGSSISQKFKTDGSSKLCAPTALGLLAKNLRNVPILQPKHEPTASKLTSSLKLCDQLAQVSKEAYTAARKHWGRLDEQIRVAPPKPAKRRVVTHSRPDGDAIVSAWLAVRYLFAGEPVEVLFVARGRVLGCFRPGDCLVDVGNTYDPKNHLYDHKPPAFPVRYDSCAARLVWEQLCANGESLKHLECLVNAVHGGDSVCHRGVYQNELAWSRRKGGFHFELDRVRLKGRSDAMVFRRLTNWLNELDDQLRAKST